MTFQLPAGLPADALRELERTCVAGGPDNMPWPTELTFHGGQLSVSRSVDESGYLVAPWRVDGFGQLMGTSATLMERPAPYHLLVELARGKVNQVRCQAADWALGGLDVPAPLQRQIHDAALAFGHAVCATGPDELSRLAQDALTLGYRAAEQLVGVYVDQVFALRHQRQGKLDTALSCPVGPGAPALGADLTETFNRVTLPLSWHVVEAEEASYTWDQADALLDWAEGQGLGVLAAGPLVDFSSSQLPAWLWLWERDVPSMTTFMCRFVEAAVRRYAPRVRRWQLTAGSNWANVLGLSEDELLAITYKLGDTARQVDPSLELLVGIAQPWGEYMGLSDRSYSPFIFADNLIRSGLHLAGLNLEVVMGVAGRGSYSRDLLEVSRLLDLYALLGVPIYATLGYPSSDRPDPDADPELRLGSGSWRGGFTPAAQAEWAEAFAALALCKPYVHGAQWAHLSDAGPHLFPHAGLVDGRGQVKPALARLRELRRRHLR